VADPYQALYRRYRSKRFSEQRGQDHVMRALRTAVQENRVGHAYLFSGPRGTGKTSTARILAKVLNCERPVDGEPCCECDNCVAVDEGRIVDWLLELDAASNNGVANIRDLIDRIPLGTSGNRKVVILDEVHMLSTGASNALLKSLEEPPSHVVFILATTDPQKVLPTIRSRTQHFEFHLLPAEELADHVRHVIADAGLDLGEEAVEHVVRQGGGSARDTLSALDQVAAMGGVVHEAQPVDAILDALQARDAGGALVAVADATAAGRDPRVLGEILIARLRDAFLAVMGAPDRHLPEPDLARAAALGAELGAAGLTRALEVLGEALVELAKKPDPRIVLEVALVRLCRPDADRSLDALLDRIERLERAVASGAVAAPPHGASIAPAPGAPAPAAEAAPHDAGPAASARAELAKARSAGATAPTGKVREPVKKATAPRATVEAAPATPSADDAGAPAGPTPATSDAPSSGPDDGPAPAPGPATSPAEVPSETELTAAWSAVLSLLKPGTKAVFGTGRFGPSTATAAIYALANAPTRDHCEKKRAEVEGALATHFGRPVPLRLVTDADLGGPGPERPSAPVAPAARAAASADEQDEIGDVHALEDAPTAATGVERLAEAFPGAELVEEQ
jgi:DNA polymerase-3 subunit gamma/tau